MRALVLSLLVLLALVHLGSGLKCYVGGKNSTTEDHVKEKLLLVPFATCTKMTTTVKGHSAVVRGGTPKKHSSGCDTKIGGIETCYCNSNRCNTATTTSPGSTAILLLPVLLLGPTVATARFA